MNLTREVVRDDDEEPEDETGNGGGHDGGTATRMGRENDGYDEEDEENVAYALGGT